MIRGSEMAVVDSNAAALGVSRKQLMESSGNAVAAAVRDMVDETAKVHVIAGRGNNGGDAFVAARFLDDYNVTTTLLGRPESITTNIALENWNTLCDANTQIASDSTSVNLRDPALIVDAMLGTGINGELREPEATTAQTINAAEAPVLSVDVPSGLDANEGTLVEGAVVADRVVTFHDTKPGLDNLEAKIDVADIGIPEAAEMRVERGDLLRLTRDPKGHKGDNGEILVVGGGPYTGAPALAAQAALRAGADLVRVVCPSSIAHAVQSYSENLIVRQVDGDKLAPTHVDPIVELAADHDVIIIGPGLGAAEETCEAVESVLMDYDGTAVVDADALQVVPNIETNATLLCTPHQGELVRMGGQTADDWRERRDLVADYAADIGHTLLVKGAVDVVSNGETTKVNMTGNSGMTVGGTGDILAGMAGALLVHQSPINAGGLAAYANGQAGDSIVDQLGYGLVATDLLEEIPLVLWSNRP